MEDNQIKRITESMKGVTCKVMVVTPSMAKKWLMNNNENRQINNGAVNRYYNDIIQGKWVLNGEPIIFDKNQILRNGQHRMMAVVKAGVPIPTVVVEGIDPSAFKSMDNGHLRTPADVLRIDNVPNARVVAGIISKFLALKYGKWAMSADGDTNLTASGKFGSRNMRVLDECRKNYDLYQELSKYVTDIKKQKPNLCKKLRLTPGDIGGLITFLHTEKGHTIEEVKAFFDELFEVNCEIENPIINDLRTILVNDYDAVNHFKPKLRQSYIAKAWMLYNTNSKQKKISLTREEEMKGVNFI